jgi:hypothetical protein
MRLLLSVLICAPFLLSPTFLIAAEPEKAKWGDPFAIADKLLEKVTLKDQENITFKEALTFLSDKYELTFQIDPPYKWSNGGLASRSNSDRKYVALLVNEQIEQTNVSIRNMKNVRLETVLCSLCGQVQGAFLIKSDHIQITSPYRANIEVRQKSFQSPDIEDDNQHWATLVHVKIKNKPLEEALDEIEIRTGVTILLAPQVGENAKTMVSAKFLNTPIDNAVSLLAEMADLKMVRKGNAYLVTTPERAELLTPKKIDEMNQIPFGGGIGGLTGGNLEGALLKLLAENKSADEAKKQITDLQQKIAELEKKLPKPNEKK